jgi:hypothetical protein
MRRTSFFALAATTLAIAAGCFATPPSDDVAQDEGALTLQPVQITPVALTAGHETKVHYTGHTRYVGKKIVARKGEDIVVSTWIHQGGVSPVAAIASESLGVLSRTVGETITGSPNDTLAWTDVIAPADGSYWVLFGEDTRESFDLELTYLVERSSGAACATKDDCLSGACVHGTCELTTVGGRCARDADCTAAKCQGAGKSAGQCADLPSGTCKLPGDCLTNVCSAGACSCVAAGHLPAITNEAFTCCSHEVDGHSGMCK